MSPNREHLTEVCIDEHRDEGQYVEELDCRDKYAAKSVEISVSIEGVKHCISDMVAYMSQQIYKAR